MELENKIYGTMEYQVYDEIRAIRGTYLSRLDECPAKAHVPLEHSDALKFGRAAHDYILRGEKEYFTRWQVAKTCQAVLKSGENKGNQCGVDSSVFDGEFWYCGRHANGVVAVAGLEVVKPYEHATIKGMYDSVHSHPFAHDLLRAGKPEVGLTWKDEETGIWCKALIDWVPGGSGHGILVNLKTARTANEYGFFSHAQKLNYHVSAAMALEGMSIVTGEQYTDMVFLTVEKEAPYRTECYSLAEDSIVCSREQGSNKFHDLLRLEKQCREKYYQAIRNDYPHEEAMKEAYPAYKYAGSETLGAWKIQSIDEGAF